MWDIFLQIVVLLGRIILSSMAGFFLKKIWRRVRRSHWWNVTLTFFKEKLWPFRRK
ncbi:MAG: hypothetical protein F6K48_06875 [Okeania sp. SIO3H1]|nr:hypothetical protein [Okeania sp. SIO3H1]